MTLAVRNMARRGRFTFPKTTWFTTRYNEAKGRMAFLLSAMLLVLAGGIHSSPVPANFSFEVALKLEVIVVRFGEDAVFNCKTNDPSANVTFFKFSLHSGYPSNRPLQPGKITNNGTTYTVHNVIVNDGGKYRCRAERQDGQAIKKDILLTIDTRDPDIAIIPFKSKRILTGSDLTYTCEATMGSIAWYKVVRGSPVQIPSANLPGLSVKSSFGKTKIVRKDLIFSNVDSSHSGLYECGLTYKGLTLEKSVHVDVRGPDPAKIMRSSNHDIWVDSDTDLELVCQTIGFPPPTVTWKKDNQLIPKCREDEPCAKTERYLQTHNGLRIVKPRYPDDDGEFSCKAKNAFGEDHRRFVVVVPSAPVLDQSYAKVYSWRGRPTNPTNIPCVLAEGSPAPTFEWLYRFCYSLKECFDWQSVKTKPFFRVKNGVSKSTLVVTSNYLPQYLYFKCTAENVRGRDQMVAKLFEVL